MKLLTLLILVTFSFNIFAVTIDTVGLLDVEIQAVDEATTAQLIELEQCVIDSNETKINETSCLNEVLGDIHN